ncbi:MAG: hypothetical protein JSV81_12660 [Anaerolineales bacterium]|nr:MAG: hypothetical protein JSV81_12660 [Anaerolineales bacterium]
MTTHIFGLKNPRRGAVRARIDVPPPLYFTWARVGRLWGNTPFYREDHPTLSEEYHKYER